jgi:hypothetical protein
MGGSVLNTAEKVAPLRVSCGEWMTGMGTPFEEFQIQLCLSRVAVWDNIG